MVMNEYLSLAEASKLIGKSKVVESRKVFHPCVLTEPCVKVSLHTALPVLNHKCINTLWMYQLPVWE